MNTLVEYTLVFWRGTSLQQYTHLQISINAVNFFRHQDLGILDDECSAGRYPPRMVLEVSSTYAMCPSIIKMTFTGASEEFHTDIQLRWPLSKCGNVTLAIEITIPLIIILDELHLQMLGRQGGNDNTANRQLLNGVVQPHQY